MRYLIYDMKGALVAIYPKNSPNLDDFTGVENTQQKVDQHGTMYFQVPPKGRRKEWKKLSISRGE